MLRYFTTKVGWRQSLARGAPYEMDNGHRMTLQEAADRLNVHYMTAYRYVRTGRLPARQEGSRWMVALSDLDALQHGGRRKRGAGRAASQTQLMDRLIAGDEPGAWAVINAALTSGMRAKEVYLDLLAGALRTIGDQWASGELSVAHEHRASALASRIIGRVGPLFAQRGRKRGTILVGTAAGDPHALPSAILADVLRGARFEVLDLGANTPPESFAQSARGPDRLVAVLIGATTTGQLRRLARSVDAVRTVRPETPILLGGAAVAGETAASRLGADGWSGHDADQAVAAVEALLH
jgi:excisionase family DNA binding protein